MLLHTISMKIRHYFHVISNVRPIYWIMLYVLLMPVFACIYMALPDGQFRIPDGGGTDYGSWLYYSIVTITTLGFGDYTPAHAMAQGVTAVEVMCGLVILGFFLNAVGSMKSEIDVESEVEKQRMLHSRQEREKLLKNTPAVLHNLNVFLSYCYAVTTPESKRSGEEVKYNPDFTFNDMADLFNPTGLPDDRTSLPAVTRLLHSASQTSLALDSLQNRVDLTLWPDVLEDCFGFVADYQMFASTESLSVKPAESSRIASEIAAWQGELNFTDHPELQPVGELFFFIKRNAGFAMNLETALTSIADRQEE